MSTGFRNRGKRSGGEVQNPQTLVAAKLSSNDAADPLPGSVGKEVEDAPSSHLSRRDVHAIALLIVLCESNSDPSEAM